MKLYEQVESGRRFMPLLPIVARIDGRAFHKFTRGMQRPFDYRFSQCMQDTMVALLEETNATIGYTQSDEITLVWHSPTTKSQVWFDGRVGKMTSQLGAQATLVFYQQVLKLMPEYAKRNPTFDARVWVVPTRAEAVNALLWRELDATKNSISMAASTHFSHKELVGKNGAQKHEMLRTVGVNWNDYPAALKRGVYARRVVETRYYTPLEVEHLPAKHVARTSPTLSVTRSRYMVVSMPPLQQITNCEEVVFEGAEPCKGLTTGGVI